MFQWLLPALIGYGVSRATSGGGGGTIDWGKILRGYQVPEKYEIPEYKLPTPYQIPEYEFVPAPSYQIPEHQTGINRALYQALIPRIRGEGVGLPVEDIMEAAREQAQSFTQKQWQKMAPTFAYGRMLKSGQARQAYQDLLKDVGVALAQQRANLLAQSEQMKQSAIENALARALGYGQYLGAETRAYQAPAMEEWRARQQMQRDLFSALMTQRRDVWEAERDRLAKLFAAQLGGNAAEWQANLNKARDVYQAIAGAVMGQAELSAQEKQNWLNALTSALMGTESTPGLLYYMFGGGK